MALSDNNEFANGDLDHLVNIRRECRAAVKIEQMELILHVVGSFGEEDGSLVEFQSKRNGNIYDCERY